MRQCILVALVLFLLPVTSWAGEFKEKLKDQWLGAYVITELETSSNCDARATHNQVRGNFVKSSGSHRFEPGELFKVNKINVRRQRIDMHLLVQEPVRVAYNEGPFTLYRYDKCKVELELEVLREVVKDKDAAAVEELLVPILERHATEQSARDSDSWNGREREPLPDDYDLTLAKLEVWRAEQFNAGVQARLDQAHDEVMGFTDRMGTDVPYVRGFARGVEDAKAASVDSCDELMGINLDQLRKGSGSYPSEFEGIDRTKRGYFDGRLFICSMNMVRYLPGCFRPVPDLPE
jgi:hypothetical protein